MPSIPRSLSRRTMFVGFCVCSIAIAAGYMARRHGASVRTSDGKVGTLVARNLEVLEKRPGLLFTSAAFDRTNGTVGMQGLGATPGERYETTLRCDRVHFAGGAGICLAADRGVFTTYSAHVLGSDFSVQHTVPLHGVPSRARVSPDGRRAAFTVFVSGDSYSSTSFSTRTTLLDMTTGQVIADLEQFAVSRAGTPFKAVDFNFWGVTFAKDSNRFFATLATGGINYLVEGNVDARTAKVLREGVECPSLSPSNTQIVFKSRVSSSKWRLHRLDLATLKDAPLAEKRSVDDQAEWVDDDSVAYMLPSNDGGGSDIWTVPIRAEGTPRVLVSQAFSPAAIQRDER